MQEGVVAVLNAMQLRAQVCSAKLISHQHTGTPPFRNLALFCRVPTCRTRPGPAAETVGIQFRGLSTTWGRRCTSDMTYIHASFQVSASASHVLTHVLQNRAADAASKEFRELSAARGLPVY